MPFLRRILRILAALTLAAAPLASQNLLADQERLDFGDFADEGDHFGSAIALSGDGKTLVVGANQAAAKGTLSGAVYVFHLEPAGWRRDESFDTTASETKAFDAYGYSVAVNKDGSVIVVGAPLHDELNGNAGAIYVWEHSDNGWSSSQLLVGEDALPNDQLGTSISLNEEGTILVTGAPQPNPVEDTAKGPPGKAYVFEKKDGAWGKKPPALLTAKDSAAFDFFGFAVAMSGDGSVVAVGAPGRGDEAGAVYAFERGSSWSDRLASPLGAENKKGDELGISVAVSADEKGATIAAGARQEDRSSEGSGYVEVFERSAASDWSRMGPLMPDPAEGDRRFGVSIAIARSGETEAILVGAPGAKGGAAYLFRLREGAPDRFRLPSCSADSKSFGQAVSFVEKIALVSDPDLLGLTCFFDLTGIEVSIDLATKSIVPGKEVEYQITVHNTSSREASNALLTVDFESPPLMGVTLSCQGSDCSPCPETSPCKPRSDDSQKITASLTRLQGGETRFFTLKAVVRPDALGKIVIHARLDVLGDVDLSENLASGPEGREAMLNPMATLEIRYLVKPVNPVVRGKPFQYVFTVTNKGPSQVRSARVQDLFDPAGAIKSFSWNKGGQERSGPLDDRNLLLAVGRILTYTITAIAREETQVRELTNKAMVSSEITGSGDNESALTILPKADLGVSVSADRTAIPGSALPLTAKVTVTNLGPDSVKGALVHIQGGSELVSIHWTCTAERRTCPMPDSGEGSPSPNVDLDPGDVLVFTLKGAVPPSLRGKVTTTASVTSSKEVPDFEQKNDADAAPTTLTARSPLTVTLSQDHPVIPGDPLPHLFTISVTNPAGNSDLLDSDSVLKVRFPEPFGAVHWECMSPDPCGSGQGNIIRKPIALMAGKTITYTIRALIDPAAISVAFFVSVEAGADDDPQALPEKSLPLPLRPVMDLAIKGHTGSRDQVIRGKTPTFTYAFTVFNAGPSDSRMAKVTHHFTPKLKPVSWTCVATNGSCPASGQGEVDTKVSLRVGGSATFTVKGSASPSSSGPLLKADASVIVTQMNATDPRGENNDLAAPAIPLTVADLAITKVFRSAEGLKPAVYEITVVNAGPSDVIGAVVLDQPKVLQAEDGLTQDASWTCTALNGSCGCRPPVECGPKPASEVGGCGASGQFVLKDTIFLRVGGRITYTLQAAALTADATANVACVSIPQDRGIDPRLENNSDEASPLPPP